MVLRVECGVECGECMPDDGWKKELHDCWGMDRLTSLLGSQARTSEEWDWHEVGEVRGRQGKAGLRNTASSVHMLTQIAVRWKWESCNMWLIVQSAAVHERGNRNITCTDDRRWRVALSRDRASHVARFCSNTHLLSLWSFFSGSLHSTAMPIHFFSFPSEIRNKIYEEALALSEPIILWAGQPYGGIYGLALPRNSRECRPLRFCSAILLANKRVHREASPLLYSRNCVRLQERTILTLFLDTSLASATKTLLQSVRPNWSCQRYSSLYCGSVHRCSHIRCPAILADA
jgi:hypothetical protein